MGYDVHITRAEHWTESKNEPFSLEEWLAYIRHDPEMRLDGYAEAEVRGGVLGIESDGLAVWTAYSGNGIGGNMAWFDHRSGRIVVKNSDEEILAKMRQIARHFNAHVIGDEGEFY
jgi:hypothetical protein